MGKRLADRNPYLKDAAKKKRVMAKAIASAQRQEGIEISEARAEQVYKLVFEEPPIAFFRLTQAGDDRERLFLKTISDQTAEVRFNISRRDLLAVDAAPLSYWLPTEVMQLFRALPGFSPGLAEAWQGIIAGTDAPFYRFFWEVLPRLDQRPWKPLHKGGAFSRFYFNADLVVDWSLSAQSSFHRLRDVTLYFRQGLTWPRAAQVFNVRYMPAGCVFSDKGPAILVKDEADIDYLMGVLNSSMILYLAKARTSREEMGGRWEKGVIQKLPLPRPALEERRRIGLLARRIHDAKAKWDQGNEVSRRFQAPWLASILGDRKDLSLSVAATEVAAAETADDEDVRGAYAQLDDAVFEAYGLSFETRSLISAALGTAPPELIWPQMEGKSSEQKRTEHIVRLLSFCVKQIVESDDDGIVPLVPCNNEPALDERVLGELGKIVGVERAHVLEGEIASELRKKVAGYRKADSIADFLANNYFEHHVRLYKSRPIFWHIASSPEGGGTPSFSVFVHYHRFGKDMLRKLRGTYVRSFIERRQREAARAQKDNRTDEAVEIRRSIEEAETFDKKLQALEEGKCPIRVPWKEASQQPNGWDPDIDDGVRVNILPLQAAGLLRIAKVVSTKGGEDDE